MLNNTNVLQATMVLKQMAQSWSQRAQVKRNHFDENIKFDDDADDFLIDLLPFKHHPYFIDAPETMQKIILSCGWIIYTNRH